MHHIQCSFLHKVTLQTQKNRQTNRANPKSSRRSIRSDNDPLRVDGQYQPSTHYFTVKSQWARARRLSVTSYIYLPPYPLFLIKLCLKFSHHIISYKSRKGLSTLGSSVIPFTCYIIILLFYTININS